MTVRTPVPAVPVGFPVVAGGGAVAVGAGDGGGGATCAPGCGVMAIANAARAAVNGPIPPGGAVGDGLGVGVAVGVTARPLGAGVPDGARGSPTAVGLRVVTMPMT